MVSFRSFAFAASTIIGVISAAPTEMSGRQAFTPSTLNNTQEFKISMHTTDGCLEKYNGYEMITYHTGAGLADPVFYPPGQGSPAYLNDTNLQFDVNAFPFSANAFPGDTNYARWEPVTIAAGYGSGGFVDAGADGIESTNVEFGGWIVCEWFHDINAPQLFQLIKGFDSQPTDLPSSCANVYLLADYF